MKRYLPSSIVLLFSAFALQCTQPEDASGPMDAGIIAILAPAAGTTFRRTDTVRVITQCDYTLFASGITIKFSADSARTWTLIKSLVRKEGKEKDTLSWIPSEEHPDDVKAVQSVLFEVYDYSRAYVTRSGFVSFSE